MRFCVPLMPKEHEQLAASKYVPLLRSKIYLSVGLGESGGAHYAYSEVKISQYGSVIDLFDALFALGRELEKLLGQSGGG